MIQLPMQRGLNRKCIVITNEAGDKKINEQHREKSMEVSAPRKKETRRRTRSREGRAENTREGTKRSHL